MANKVNFGLKNVKYSVLTEGQTNSWATPVAIAGAVSLNIDVSQDESKFYADNELYFSSYGAKSFTGTLEVAKLPESFYTDVMRYTTDEQNGTLKDNDNEPYYFGLIFQIDGDDSESVYQFFKVKASTPSIAASTIAESKEVKTQTLNFTAMAISGRTFLRSSDTATAQQKATLLSAISY